MVLSRFGASAVASERSEKLTALRLFFSLPLGIACKPALLSLASSIASGAWGGAGPPDSCESEVSNIAARSLRGLRTERREVAPVAGGGSGRSAYGAQKDLAVFVQYRVPLPLSVIPGGSAPEDRAHDSWLHSD